MTGRVASIAVLVAAAIVVLLVAGSDDMRRVTAEVDGARGLVAGAEVRAGGQQIGEVRDVELGPDARPVVRMDVERDYELRAGATAAVRMQSLSGEFNRYVALTRGTGAPVTGDLRIPRSRTAAPVEVDAALKALGPRQRADVRATLLGLHRSLDERGPQVALTLRAAPRALEEIAAAAGDVADDGAALRRLVGGTRAITGALARDPARLQAAVQRTRDALDVTARRQRELRAGLDGLPAGLRAARGALAQTHAALPTLRALVRSARPPAAALPPAAGELRRALGAARPALAHARGLARTGPADLRALTPLLREAAPLADRLDVVLRRSGPMLDQTRVRLPDFFSFFANWADFTGTYDVNGHGARVGIVLPPAPTQVLAPDSDGAGQLRPPYLRTPGSLEGEPWRAYADSFVAGGRPAADAGSAGP